MQKASAFYRWNALTTASHEERVTLALNSKFEQLEFQMSLNNTKLRLGQSGFSSRLELLE